MGQMSTNLPQTHAILTILASLLLSLSARKINCSTLPGNSTDVQSLFAFKAANDLTGVLNSWNSSTNHCFWMGVNCSLTHPGRVTALELSGIQLSGSISSSLANLTFLRTLDLSANRLSGELPPLGHLHKLEVLNLSSNLLQGGVPDLTNCSNLRVLDLARNSLAGEIPPQVGLLSNLSILRLSWNSLTGKIPPNIGNITHIKFVGLSYNHLTGRIPHGFGKLRNVSQFFLGFNNLVGEIPIDIFNMSSLQRISLVSNNLTGALPLNMGDVLPNIQYLYFGMNMFEGSIPASVGNASALELIDLSSNSFIGQIPNSLGKLSKLSLLNLEVNKLGAGDTQSLDFINALTNCPLLTVLTVRQNQLQGTIPNSIGNLSVNLQQLLLGSNNLSGLVPPSITNLRGLNKLGLGSNSFTGTIEWISQLHKLNALLLQDNYFSGNIPYSISNLTLLTLLYLGNNKFEGTIPSSLGNLQKLTSLDLSFNNLQSSIPLEIGKLIQLFNLSVSSNQLTGEIPNTLGQCQSLTTIRMDRNFLTGNIPVVFSSLQSLNVLNLSHNYLSGTIPSNLSNLQLLNSLDLSYNHLYGDVPRNGAFANATIISLNGNVGLCGGPIDLHMPTCPDNSQGIKRRNHLITILIPIFGLLSLVLLVYLLFFAKKVSGKSHLSMSYFGDKFLKLSYNDLAEATNNFSEVNLVGRGSYGSVYRGKLKEDKMEVAVKVFNLDMRGAERSFMSECEALRSIQHRNLLPIITACSTVDNQGHVFKALVYEFMPNGNLDAWLHQKEDGKEKKRLSFTQRVSISVNIADALDYLHHDCGRPTIHCDLKPSNVLLNDDMVALLGDFGIASFYMDSLSQSTGGPVSSSVGMKGTIGYIAPEYAGGRHASTSGDVYSFGVVLLEMMVGKRPTDPMFKDGVDIVSFVESNFPHNILHVIDAHVIEECKDFVQMKESMAHRSLVSLLQVALHCTRSMPGERMNMKQVAGKVHEIKESYLGWKTKKNGSHELA